MNQITPFRTGRLKTFTDPAKAFRAGKFAQALLGNVEAKHWCAANGIELKAHSEGVNSAGGFLVPAEFIPAIIALRENYGVFRRYADVFPMASELAIRPRRRSGVTTYFATEATAATASQAALDGVNMVAQKLIALAIVSAELDEDSAVDLGDFFLDEMAYAFAKTEDDCGFIGDGTATYGGITGITSLLLDGTRDAGKVVAAAGHDTFAEIDATDLNSLLAKVPGYALPGAKWYLSQTAFALVFCRLAGSLGGFVTRVVDGRSALTFYGFPVEICQSLPQVTTDLSGQVMMLFGDLSLAASLGDRRELTVARSTEHKFAEDQVAFKGSERIALNIHDLGDNTTAGPIVGLVGE